MEPGRRRTVAMFRPQDGTHAELRQPGLPQDDRGPSESGKEPVSADQVTALGKAISFLPSYICHSLCLVMVALCNRADHYIFILFPSSSFFSSPNLSGRKLDVYHTMAHDVALVRI